MAIGDTNNSNNGKKLFENTYYSRLRFKSPDGKLALTPSFRSGLLIFDISELKEAEGFKYDSLISIYLSPTKARLFAKQIVEFEQYYASGAIEPGKAFGVNAGMGDKVSFIAIHADPEHNILITIGKFNDSGVVIDQATIMLNCKEYHFSLQWDNINDMDTVGKCYNNLIEIDQIKELCTDFGRNMSGAIGYSVADLTRFDLARVLGKMDPIFDKLGIERKYGNNNNQNYNRGNSFLDNSKGLSSSHTSIDDILGD